MADEHTDLIMKLVKGGNPIPAETTTQVDLLKSDMTKGFKAGFFFELDSFTMETGTESEDEDAKKDKADKANTNKTVAKTAGAMMDLFDHISQLREHLDRIEAAARKRGELQNRGSGRPGAAAAWRN